MLPDPAGIKPMIWSHAGLSNQGWLVNIHQLVQTRIFFLQTIWLLYWKRNRNLGINILISVYHSDVMKIPPLCYIWSFWSVYTRVMLWKYLLMLHLIVLISVYQWFYENTSLMLHLIVLISVYHSDVMKILPYATFDHSDQCTPEWCYENTSLCYIWLFWSVYTSDVMKIPPLWYIWLFWSVYTTVMLWIYFLMLHLIVLISVYQ